MRKALVYVKGVPAAHLTEHGPSGTPGAYRLTYLAEYLANPAARPVSLLLPLQSEVYQSATLFPIFDNMLPEGDFRRRICRALHADAEDSFGLLLALARQDSIGDITLTRLD